MSSARRIFGAVEAGGTKFVLAIADEVGQILTRARIPTRDPESTLTQVRQFLKEEGRPLGTFSAIGVACFGPLVLAKEAPNYGCIASTPKPGWSGTRIAGLLAREFSCAVGFDTDVNAAALAEHRFGIAQDVTNLVYVTVGTGIGGGALISGVPVHGLMHPEMGHILPRRHPQDGAFLGVCPFHADCLEGLASGPAIVARSGAPLSALPASHPQWEIEAHYLGQLCAQLVLLLSPQRIVMGGGVMQHPRLLPLVRTQLLHSLGGYIDCAEILAHADRFLVAPGLGNDSGILGALALAMAASPATCA